MALKAVAHGDWPREMWRAGVETVMQVSAATGAQHICIFEQWVAPGTGAATHSHPVEEVLTVVAGTADMWIDEEHAAVTSGQSLIVPAHRRHGFKNIGSDVLHIHAVLASPIFEALPDGATESVRRWVLQPDHLTEP